MIKTGDLEIKVVDTLHKKKRLTSFQIIIMGFAGVIVAGALLLMLPISSKNGIVTPFLEALFTSTSAVCVTGLVLHDTASYWSLFGQAVIIILIQIGGLGVVTVAASFALLSGRKITLLQRSTMQEAISAQKVGGIVRLTGFVLKCTFLFELLGALIMMPVFIKDFGTKGIWMAFFHSISAFCNAGFDIMGSVKEPFVSLTAYTGNVVINMTVMFLIIIGGVGFLTWEDVYSNKHRMKHYRMQTKVILTTTILLIVLSALFNFYVEFTDYSLKERILASFFQAVTPRTAGFNTIRLSDMTEAGQTIMIVLMLIGGSPGSTAGGMKTTTLAVLIANVSASVYRKEDPHLFGRRIESGIVKNAITVCMMYIAMFLGGGHIISIAEDLPVGVCLYETASAVGTVGLSLGITPDLGFVSRMVLIVLMFLGRVGGLTLIYAALSGTHKNLYKLPQERITVG